MKTLSEQFEEAVEKANEDNASDDPNWDFIPQLVAIVKARDEALIKCFEDLELIDADGTDCYDSDDVYRVLDSFMKEYNEENNR